MATTSLGRLTVDLMMKTSGLEQGTREGKKHLKDLEKSVTGVEKFVSKSFLAAGAAAIGFAAAAAKVTTDSIKAIAAQADLADSLNSTVTGLRAVNKMASDFSIDGMSDAMARLNVNLGKAESGTGSAVNAIKALGLSAQEIGAADADEKLALIADAIKKSGMSAQQAAGYLQDLGFSQTGVYNIFRDGGGAIREYREQIEATGQAVNAIEAVKIQQAAIALNHMNDSWEGIKTQLDIQLAPVIEKIATMINGAGIDGVNAATLVSDAFSTTVKVIGFVADAFVGLKRTFSVAADVIIGLIATLEVGVLRFADFILFGPTDAVNALIEQINRIPGINIPPVKQNAFSQSIKDAIKEAEGVVSEAGKHIQDTLLEPLPSTKIDEFIASAKRAADESAQAMIDSRQNMNIQTSRLADQQSAAEKAKMDSHIADLLGYGMTRQEVVAKQYMDENALIADQLQKKAITEADAMSAAQNSQQKYADAMKAIDKEQMQAKVSGIQGALGSISTLMNSENKKLFEIGKAAAIANAIIDTSSGVLKAWALGPIIGPPLAALVAAAGAAQIATIASTKIGGGSSGASTSQAVSASAAPVQTTQQQQTTEIYLRGISSGDIFTGAQVLELLNSEVMRGGVIAGAGR